MDPNLKPLITMSVMAVVFILISIPLVLKKVPPNAVYGFRTRKTLSSPEIWYPANRLGAISLIAACIFTLAAYALLYFYRKGFTFEQMNLSALTLSIGPVLISIVFTLFKIRKM